jgi:hypothetical protein
VLRPVAVDSPTEAEFSKHNRSWQFIHLPKDLTERELDTDDLSAIARANPKFKFGKVLHATTATLTGGEPWEFRFGATTRMTVTVIYPTPPLLAGAKPGDIPCRIQALFATAANPISSTDIDGRWTIKGRFEIPSARISVFDAGQSYSMISTSKPAKRARFRHNPRDLILVSICPKMKGEASDEG